MMSKTLALAGAFLILLLCVASYFYWPEEAYQPFQVLEAYQEQANSYDVPEMPGDWQWSSFETKDKVNLRWGQTGNSGTSEITLLLIPGYTATLEMYGEHIDLLAERGFHVVGLDLRGQGGSERYFKEQPEKLWVEDFSIYSRDVADFIRDLHLKPDHKIIPVAISFGGHVALRMAVEYRDVVDGLVLVAPAIKPKAGKYNFDQALTLMNLMRRIGLSNRYVFGGGDWRPEGQDYTIAGPDLCSSEAKRLYLRDTIFTNNPKLRVGDVTNQWGAEFFKSSLFLRGSRVFDRLDTPILMISADQDDYVSTEVNKSLCDETLPACKNIHYSRTGHCLLQETDKVVFDILMNIESFALKL